jgi:type II secretory pathway pseudopilin PulG
MTRLKQQPGFAMIEAVVAMAVLSIVVMGVLVGLDSAQRSSGREKARSVAAALTEQDQERLRSFRAVDLDNYDETRTITVNKAPYVISSQADWVRDSTGGTQSCVNSLTQADYMRVTSTTSSGLINAPIPPIKMSSLVAPPVGAFGSNQGTLGVQVNNRDGVGVEGVPVSITGPATLSNPTNSAGCAIFAYIPVGTYAATATQAGSVDKGGNPSGTTPGAVANGTVNVATPIEYDEASSVVVTFDTEPRLGTPTVPALIPAASTQVAASNSGVPAGPFSPFAKLRVVDPAGSAAQSSITMTGLYPFSNGYGVFGGGCPGADPTKYISNYYTLNPTDFIATDPGVAAPAVVARLPSINLRVYYGTTSTPTAGTPVPLPLTSPVRITATSKTTGCTEKFIFPVTSLVTGATDALGWMTPSALPFGDYDVCADALKPGSTTQHITKSLNASTTGLVKNYFAQGIKPPAAASPVIDLNTGASNGTCP